MAGVQETKIHVLSSGAEIQQAVCDRVVQIAASCIKERGMFSVGLSGGSLTKYLSNGLRDRTDIDWPRWYVFFCDERFVPFADKESTYSVYKRDLFNHVFLLPEKTITINPCLATVEEAASDYTDKIRRVYPKDAVPSFDLLLLGMGDDGHTCSLFPSHPLLKEKEKIVASLSDSPKPPPSRITLTLPVLNNARNVFFVAAGEGKAKAVKDSLEPEGEPTLPAGMVKPTGGELHWYLDTGAAKGLSKK
ncbi:PREDICTED: 6-phosphogluconolactonase-like isoform X2 [Amphimedon queenslandica]|uniref:6-phosphogluconolactonase n=1 Tax=Amphimedon queenslandica TaxID=400682 RepID=A0A1X7VEJ0_AMPQE|nr:PREDICTED: 6-phosphogluconolactonase-like isoform X2 [Amphimedon queenslandica]|eukprot:XP_003384657.1 PREDICTED: 6-phosphogluconolactonase-like isoform X2 [Amphimedon queenslandica]